MQQKSQGDKTRGTSNRKRYEQPRLVEYGSLLNLVRGPNNTQPDPGNVGTKNPQ